MNKPRAISIALTVTALLFMSLGVVNAALVTTNVLRAWDDSTKQYENGNMTVYLNSEPESFYAKMDFNNDPHPDACGVGTISPWAGDAIIGVYNTDNSPDGGFGYQSTGNWSIVKCTAFQDAKGNDTIKNPAPADILATCISGQQQDGPCVLIGTQDQQVPCADNGGTGTNCKFEIQTQFHINLDVGTALGSPTSCDGTIDPPFVGVWSANPQDNNLCLYWEATKPSINDTPYWKGPLQGRFGVVNGGDKTINFGAPGKGVFLGPNAVSVSSLKAVAQANGASLAAWAVGMALAAVGLLIWRRNS